jgi:hypothetical protein
VSEEAHYRFPPAAAYRLNRCLYRLKSDPDFCARFLADPSAAADEVGLAADERALLQPIDRQALAQRGAHPYLVFMADLRLKMARDASGLELF